MCKLQALLKAINFENLPGVKVTAPVAAFTPRNSNRGPRGPRKAATTEAQA